MVAWMPVMLLAFLQTPGSGAADPAFASPVPLARQAESLAARARDLGPSTEDGAEYARDAARWCVYAHAAILYRDEPTDEERDAVTSALSACAQVIPTETRLEDLRPLRQSSQHLCAVASTRMLLAHWGIDVSEADLLEVFGREAVSRGVHVNAVLDALPLYGVSALACAGSSDLVRVCLTAGLPVAVYQWVRSDRDVRHMRVVVGYDTAEEDGPGWILADPAREMPELWRATDEEFMRLWDCHWDSEGHTQWMCVPYLGPS
jgi:hypothetical protein